MPLGGAYTCSMSEISTVVPPIAHGPTRSFWEERFANRQTPWDRGSANPQLLRWLEDGTLAAACTDGAVAVPGCGSGHEVAALAAAGLPVVAIDYTAAAIELTRARLQANATKVELVQADVLCWQPARALAAVYEQTCLCALHPDHWTAYAAQLHAWLRPGGRLLALFMQAQREGAAQGFIEGPPYHCNIHAMRALFPATLWDWPKPPYDVVPHLGGSNELALVLKRR